MQKHTTGKTCSIADGLTATTAPETKASRLWLESRDARCAALPQKSKLCGGDFCRLSVKSKDRCIQGGIEFENRGQFGKLQQLADEMAGSSQLDRALAGLRRQDSRYECSEASGVHHFHSAQVDHDSTGLGRKLGNFAGQRGSFNAISDSAFAADHSNVFGYPGFETQPQRRLLILTVQALLFPQ